MVYPAAKQGSTDGKLVAVYPVVPIDADPPPPGALVGALQVGISHTG